MPSTRIFRLLSGSRTCHTYEDNCDCAPCLQRSWQELVKGLRKDLGAAWRRVTGR